ncbi:MAG: glycosyltransferase family 2 protein, partial [Candidatus Cryptobacteroides sp.]
MWMSPRECKESLSGMGALVIMPTYNNAGTVGEVLADLIKYAEDILVVDDGCTDLTIDILRTFGFSEIPSGQGCLTLKGKKVLRHPRNMGKGAALRNALTIASEAGYSYAVTIDADGQHFLSDLPVFVTAHKDYPDSLLVGARNLESENMPGTNTFANRFSNFWYRLETGIRLEDTQCGYRLYPLKSCNWTRWYYTRLYEFELEAIVFSAWSGTDVRNVPVRVYYPPQEKRVSHFRPLRDFTRISILNTFLVLISLLYVKPRDFLRKCTWKNICKFFDDNLIHVKDTNRKLVFSVWVGTFAAFMPF